MAARCLEGQVERRAIETLSLDQHLQESRTVVRPVLAVVDPQHALRAVVLDGVIALGPCHSRIIVS